MYNHVCTTFCTTPARALDDITAGLIETNSSFLWYTSQISDGAKEIFSKLGLKLPGKVLGVESKV
jgi:hypothetical protein